MVLLAQNRTLALSALYKTVPKWTDWKQKGGTLRSYRRSENDTGRPIDYIQLDSEAADFVRDLLYRTIKPAIVLRKGPQAWSMFEDRWMSTSTGRCYPDSSVKLQSAVVWITDLMNARRYAPF